MINNKNVDLKSYFVYLTIPPKLYAAWRLSTGLFGACLRHSCTTGSVKPFSVRRGRSNSTVFHGSSGTRQETRTIYAYGRAEKWNDFFPVLHISPELLRAVVLGREKIIYKYSNSWTATTCKRTSHALIFPNFWRPIPPSIPPRILANKNRPKTAIVNRCGPWENVGSQK